jgi:hypothetical protein
VKLAAHGISIELPPRWTGRVWHRAGSGATLHAGDFQLALGDGEFGGASTAAMPAGATFVALTEYLPGAGLQPGRGLFAARRIPGRLDPSAFAANRLAHPRRGQAGYQHFFTAGERPFCLYVVVAASGPLRGRRLAVLDRVLATLRIAGAGAGPPTYLAES